MTNPAQAIRMLVTYVVVIPLAALVGWLLCNPMDYGTLGFFGFLALILASPIFIRLHYPILLFGLGCPAYCFFLQGDPPLWQVVVILSLGLSIIERTLSSDRRFISAPVMTWPLVFTFVMVLMTAELTGGIGLHQLGGSVSGGKKYIELLLGIGIYFALVSRKIPKEKRNLSIALVFLAGAPGVLSDLFPVLPAPLNYVNLIFPPSADLVDATSDGSYAVGSYRLGALSSAAGVVYVFMLVKHGFRGILYSGSPWRMGLFLFSVILSLYGGFRIVFIGMLMNFSLLFFLEGLHRTRLLPVVVLGVILASAVTIPFSDKLPIVLQRSISFLPVKVDPKVAIDAESSKVWRENMWHDLWPKVPQYLLLGKGYALHEEDFQYMGNGTFGGNDQLDASGSGLAVSGDYHNGPLSTLMPFGLWGAISFLWVAGACLFVTYRNYLYGDEELKNLNRFWLVMAVTKLLGFFILFGAYSGDIGFFAKLAGFSVAFNWGVCKAKQTAPPPQRIRRLPQPAIAARA